ncbi:MAG TPA: hypothetical protein VLQ68_05415, partial [Rhizobiaceae bacterium]|nr:hypothetical protein [Rhizobiaceae bacterium]
MHSLRERKMDKESRDPESIREELGTLLDELSQICAKLEKIADDLPENVDRQQCMALARSMYPTIIRAHKFEEGIVFP